MTTPMGYKVLVIIALASVAAREASTQVTETRRIGASVSYPSSGSVYLDVGRTGGLAVGDTVTIRHGLQQVAVAVIAAISSSSSNALLVSHVRSVAVGDSAFVTKVVDLADGSRLELSTRTATSEASEKSVSKSNILSGRLALQYGAAGVVGEGLDFSQPAAVMRLEVAGLFGTGARFSMYGRTYYDLSAQFDRYGLGSRWKTRMYELSLSFDNASSWYGYSLGRVVSPRASGLGVFDGAEVFIRKGIVTVGVLAGAQADYTSSSVNPDLQKYAGFLNVVWGKDVFTGPNMTLAYGQQMYRGKLDRDFLYIQNSLRFGSDLFLYGSAEFAIHDMKDGQRMARPRLTNTFVNVSYGPLSWLTVNAGFDAARAVYLFESMKSISDLLFDKSLKEGYRLSFLVRLPANMALTTQGMFRLASGTTGSARTLGATLRANDVVGTNVNLGVQYANILGLYTEGHDMTFDLDSWIAHSLLLSLRVNKYTYRIKGQEGWFVSTTVGANANVRLSRAMYCVVNFDRVWDDARATRRIYCELGMHF